METFREYVYPFETMFCKYPPPYLSPEQSNYHNLGLNGYITMGRVNQPYPDKRPGMVGDWGPRQVSDGESVRHGIYPLDIPVQNFNNRNDYRMMPYVQSQKMSLKSLDLLADALTTCHSPKY